MTLAYDSLGRVTRLVNSDGGTDSSGNPVGPTWAFTYSSYTRSGTGSALTTTSATDPRGQVWTYVSDGRGRVGQVTDPLSKTVTTTFTPNDDVVNTTKATPATSGGGATSTNTYNSGAWTMTSTRTPTGAGQLLTYGSGSRTYDVISSTDARGVQSTYTYDAAGNQLTVSTGGVTITKLYQGSTDPTYGGVVNCGPTVNGAVTATKPGLLCESRDGAYIAGSTAATTTAHRTLYRYNALGEMVSLTPPSPSAQAQQTYIYDSLSRLTQIKDGKGQTTIYGYDALDHQTYVMFPDGSSQSNYITADGQLRSVTEYDSANNPTRYSEYQRDKLNRLVRLVAPEGTSTMSYNASDALTSYDDGAGAVSYGYNGAGQLTSAAEPGGSCSGQSFANPGAASTKCILFQVNNDGERTAVRYPGGQVQATALDDSGRISRISGKTSTDNGATTATRLDFTLAYADSTAPSTGTNPNRDTVLVTSINDNEAYSLGL